MSTPLGKRKLPRSTLPYLGNLLDIAVEHLKSSNLITKEDRDFLKYHWRKTVSSTADHKTRDAVMKKLARREKSADPFTPNPASTPTPTPTPTPASTPTPTPTRHSASSQESNDEFRPERACSTTDDSTGKVEAATVKEALDNWGISDGCHRFLL